MSTQDVRSAAEGWIKLPDRELEPQRRRLVDAFKAHATDRYFTIDIPDSVDKEQYITFVQKELGNSGVFVRASVNNPRLVIFARTYDGIGACEQTI